MRTVALPSIMEVIARNYNFNNDNVRLFEIATVYIPTGADTLPNENKVLCAAMYGNCDFYAMKGVCENILKLADIKNATISSADDNPSYHPGRYAKISVDGKVIGVLGQIHPLTANNYGVSTPVYACELDFDAIFGMMNATKLYTPLPKFPAIERDLAFVCDEALTSGELKKSIQKYGGKMLENVEIFDIYRDKIEDFQDRTT